MLYHQLLKNEQASEWVVFIHGAGGSSNVWYRQIRPFGRHYNLLLVDLRGHGQSAGRPPVQAETQSAYTFDELAGDVIEILDTYGLRGCHFIGLSLGTIVIYEIAATDRSYVRSMILAGAILQLDTRTRILSQAADLLKRCIPYMALYRFYARLVMPKAAHNRSRLIFIRNAMKISHNEFLNWMTLNRNLDRKLRFYANELPVPTLYVMGENDYVFLSQVRLRLQQQHRHSLLHIIPHAGHICNIDRYEAFNDIALQYLRDLPAIFR